MTEVRTRSETGGEKGEKPERYDLIPVEGWAEVARVFGYGATKYEDRNWERGYEWHKSFAALMRHVMAFWSGESIDPESNCHHLAHAAAHCLFLMQFEQYHPTYDDRSKLGRTAKSLSREGGRAGEGEDLYAPRYDVRGGTIVRRRRFPAVLRDR